MRRNALVIMWVVFLGVVFLVACGDRNAAEKSGTKVTSADVKKEAKEAIETTKAYSLQQKEEYQKQMEAKLQDFDREIQSLQDKVKSGASALKEDSIAKFNQSMEELSKKKQAVAEKLNELKSESGKAWEDTKSGVDNAMDELGKAYDRARSHFGS
jgi:septation ring formation regulator EzrA